MLICVFLFRRYKITFHMTHLSNIIKAVSFFKKTSLNKNKFYLCFVYLTINFLLLQVWDEGGRLANITKGTLCSRTPRWSPSLQKRRIRRSTWSWPSVSGSWWGCSTGPSGRRLDTGLFYCWRCSFYDPYYAWAARGPSLLGTSALCGGGDRGQVIR